MPEDGHGQALSFAGVDPIEEATCQFLFLRLRLHYRQPAPVTSWYEAEHLAHTEFSHDVGCCDRCRPQDHVHKLRPLDVSEVAQYGRIQDVADHFGEGMSAQRHEFGLSVLYADRSQPQADAKPIEPGYQLKAVHGK